MVLFSDQASEDNVRFKAMSLCFREKKLNKNFTLLWKFRVTRKHDKGDMGL